MQGAAVEEGRGGGAEAAAFVEVVKTDGPVFALGFFSFEEAHGDTHPEELGGLDAAVLVAGLVDDEVAVVEGLDAEEVEVEVGGGVKGLSQGVEVVEFEQLGVEALDGDAVLEVALEGGFVGILELFDAVAEDRPVEDFLVDVGKEDAGGELGEVGVFLDQRLGVEDDGVLEVLLLDLCADGAAEFAFDLGLGEAEVEADGGELDALPELGAIPELGLAVVGDDGDEELLIGVVGGFLEVDAHA